YPDSLLRCRQPPVNFRQGMVRFPHSRPGSGEAVLLAGNDGDGVPRLAAVVERQRRELALARAEAELTAVVAMARGVLMERHGWSMTEAARQLADMAAAAGIPVHEMAAAVLGQEPPAMPGLDEPEHE